VCWCVVVVLWCCDKGSKSRKHANTHHNQAAKPPSQANKPTSQQATKPTTIKPPSTQLLGSSPHNTVAFVGVTCICVCLCVRVCSSAGGWLRGVHSSRRRRRCWAFSLARRVVVGDLLVVAPMEASLCWYFRAARSCCRHSSCWFSSASAGRSLLCGKKCAEVESWVSAGWRKLRAGFPRTKQTNKKNKNSLASNSLLFFRDETTEGMLGEERFGFVRERLHEKGK
jgi:hypothetical protein